MFAAASLQRVARSHCARKFSLVLLLVIARFGDALSWGKKFMNIFPKRLIPFSSSSSSLSTRKLSGSSDRMLQISAAKIPTWSELSEKVVSTPLGEHLIEQEKLREEGAGLPHTDAKLRLFGTTEEPRVVYYRDTAAWCPYCQKVWILLEEKKIPYRVEKINMRSYGEKPAEFLRKVPNGLLPAISIDGVLQTESLQIMLDLDRRFTGPAHKPMWPSEERGDSPETIQRAVALMRLERELFGYWCGLVFRPSMGGSSRRGFEACMDRVNTELEVVAGSPWFLKDLSIVDLTYVTHIERMCASVLYWSGFAIRGEGRWPAIERWLTAFEQLPSYMATKSDYYTHVMDIPPQYGPGYSVSGSEARAREIDGKSQARASSRHWHLPLPSLSATDAVEPVIPELDPGDEAARQHAAYKLIKNHAAVTKFALRGAGAPGRKQFSAPLADPYAVPAEEYLEGMDACMRLVTHALLDGYTNVPLLSELTNGDIKSKESGSDPMSVVNAPASALAVSAAYLRDRVGVPRDMPYPAARQLRAHLNWLIDQLQ